MDKKRIDIIGGGLSGSELALSLARYGIGSTVYEQRPERQTEAHQTGQFAELVCSNSLKAEALSTSSGLLKAELKELGSPLLELAEKARVPGGGALTVDRELFGELVTKAIENETLIDVVRREVKTLDELKAEDNIVVVASGPLTSLDLSNDIKRISGSNELYFFDAISPIISADSINYEKLYFKDRYADTFDGDYLNIPLTKDEYLEFYNKLISAEKTAFEEFEMNVYEACMPIEEMASRGVQTLTFGPMRPVGLMAPDGTKPYAVIQLRYENLNKTSFNIVGFQTKMKIGEQKRVFTTLPGLENAEFLRYGSVHRNTYINSPTLLNSDLSFKHDKDIYFVGQITGVEGYVESIATSTILAFMLNNNDKTIEFPSDTALGSLMLHVCGKLNNHSSSENNYTPSNFHFGMLPTIDKVIGYSKNGKAIKVSKHDKKLMYSERAVSSLKNYLQST